MSNKECVYCGDEGSVVHVLWECSAYRAESASKPGR